MIQYTYDSSLLMPRSIILSSICLRQIIFPSSRASWNKEPLNGKSILKGTENLKYYPSRFATMVKIVAMATVSPVSS